MNDSATALIGDLPAPVQDQATRLAPEAREIFLRKYRKRARSRKGAYLWWLVGLHHLYFGKRALCAWFRLLAAPVTMWAILDLFRIPRRGQGAQPPPGKRTPRRGGESIQPSLTTRRSAHSGLLQAETARRDAVSALSQ